MRRPSKAALRFVRALLAGGDAHRAGETYAVEHERRTVQLPAGEVQALVSDGVLSGSDGGCRATRDSTQWLKRQLIEVDAFAAQHRIEQREADGTVLNLAESPLARLALATDGSPAFLAPHQVATGERLRKLVERAQLQQRLTMSYSAAHTASKGAGHAGDLSDMAADARKTLAALHQQLPRDCAEVVLDVCGFGKGLQQIETERNWPRRSAKLVLRIGLDRLADLWGIGEVATGVETIRRRAWMDGARVAMFG